MIFSKILSQTSLREWTYLGLSRWCQNFIIIIILAKCDFNWNIYI